MAGLAEVGEGTVPYVLDSAPVDRNSMRVGT